MRKIRVAIAFGGRSAEHEISLQSAKNIIDAIDRTRYDPILIAIDRDGTWYLNDASLPFLNADDPKRIGLNASDEGIALIPNRGRGEMIGVNAERNVGAIDVVFPVLHGPYGEDGSIQGLTKMANLPCVGAGILGSALGMDKDISKRLLRAAGIAVTEYLVVREPKIDGTAAQQIGSTLGFPLFVKPANLGSSVGIAQAGNETELIAAVSEAAHYDNKIVVEKAVTGREIECAVLGNDEPIASVVGEITPNDEFYSYDAKYIDENGALLSIPADIDERTQRKAQEIAKASFGILECSGMARVDMFLTRTGEIVVNEINTIPGFTRNSMYPKLWEASGIPYAELIDRLIRLAIEKHETQSRLRIRRERYR